MTEKELRAMADEIRQLSLTEPSRGWALKKIEAALTKVWNLRGEADDREVWAEFPSTTSEISERIRRLRIEEDEHDT